MCSSDLGTMPTGAANVSQILTFDIGQADVIGITVLGLDANVPLGAIRVRAYLQSSATSWVIKTLLFCPLNAGGVSWNEGAPTQFGMAPNGMLAVQTWNVPNPAAGVDWSYASAANEFVGEIVGISALLTTSATVGNRTVGLAIQYQDVITAGGPSIYLSNSATAVTASQTITFNWMAYPQPSAIGPLTNFQFQQIPPRTGFGNTSALKTITSGILAGDQWSLILLYTRRIEV